MKRVISLLSTTFVIAGFAAMPLAAQGRAVGRPTSAPMTVASQGRGTPPTTPPGKPMTPPSQKPATPPKSGKTVAPPMTATEHLAHQPKLAANLQALLPAGTTVETASVGFKSLGAFVSAVHVSTNLGIPFDQLKAKITGPNAVSLGKAIQQLQPTANAAAEVKKANAQAKKDMSEGKGDGK